MHHTRSLDDCERRSDGSVTPIDLRTAKPGRPIAVDDSYNIYFTSDGKSAIVVADARRRLDFRDLHTMAAVFDRCPLLRWHQSGRLSIDGSYALFTCEFDGSVAKIDLAGRKVWGCLKLAMPSTRFRECIDPGGGIHGRESVPKRQYDGCTNRCRAGGSGITQRLFAATTTAGTDTAFRQGQSIRQPSLQDPSQILGLDDVDEPARQGLKQRTYGKFLQDSQGRADLSDPL